MNELLSINIKRKLREQGGDINSLSEQLGITRQSLHRRLNNNPTLSTLNEIADALGCRVVDLLIEPCEQIVPTDCANNEPVITNLIECPNCGTKMYVSAIRDIK
jgi:DNA-binding Xre family transcriptional regulator